ncbi:MAG: ribosome biogenesis GTPase Der [Cellvibrionales bacterium]|nr:ribosome biogenesis GTPase Der [Porticoccaceae bacterium]|tara:strand:+ start:8043 stop:9434 length:1392 start_codon:yes stop_codon:yes gene_type:complete
MIPVIALVGRPNVGKSTLFNRLTRSRDALVANYSGLTRDRKYGDGEMFDRRFMVIDTGGISGEEEGIDVEMAEQSLLAMDEADVVLFIVDCRSGIVSADYMIAEKLRRKNRLVYLVANKIDGLDPAAALADFYQLGFAGMFATTATHGRGVRSMMEEVLTAFEVPSDNADDRTDSIKIGVVGRPNVGKSTLVNRLLGEDRVVVFDQPGTTRDSVYIDFERRGQNYTLIDTAGVRKRKNIKLAIEKFSIVKTLQAIDDANVVVLMIDAQEGLVEQDLHLIGSVIDAGRGLVIGINKWDGLEPQHRDHIKVEIKRRLIFADFAKVHFISALHGTGVGNLYDSIGAAYSAATDTLSASRLTKVLEGAVEDHQPPMVHGRRVKLRFAHAGGRNPPVIIIHGNQTDAVPAQYTRYLEKIFRRELGLQGTPVRVEYRTGDNPYKHKAVAAGDRQGMKRKKIVKYSKRND